jgi:hypothetical protein
VGCQKSFLGVSGHATARLWCAIACCRHVGGAGGLVVRLPGAMPPLRVDGAVLAVGGRQRGRDPGPPPPADSPAPPAPTASAPAPGPCAACRPEPPPAQAPMVDLRGHTRDAASMAPSHGAPTLDLSNPATRPTADSRSAAEHDRAAGHREPTVGLPAHPRGAAAAWLSGLRQLYRQGRARQRPPAGTATGPHHLAVVPTPAGSRHPRLRLPHRGHRGHRVPATAVRAVLHPASQPACASHRRHHQPHRCLGRPTGP